MLLEYNLKSTEIFVITHKPCKLIPKDNIYKMIQAGAAGKDHFLPLTDDMFKDNISNKNASFCELTAMYHIWKHSNADISKARKLLGYEPEYDFAAGIKLAIDWYKENL